jgi:uncharacterized RDD family membrane protein YckC
MASSQAVSLVTPPAANYASLGRRIGAYLVDLVLQLCMLLAVSFTLRFMRSAGLWSPNQDLAPPEQWHLLGIGSKLLVLAAFVASMGVGAFQQIVMEASPWQATIGKRLLNAFVTDNAQQRISVGRSSARWVCMSVFGFIGAFASLITVGFGEQRKALHDMAANTLVLTGKPAGNAGLEPWRLLVAFAIPYLWLLLTFYITLQ